MYDINVYNVDETNVRIEAIRPILVEIYNHFKFYVKGYKFHPKYKAGFWDGTISLFKIKDSLLLKGLLPDLTAFADEAGYSYSLSDKVTASFSDFNVDEEKVRKIYAKFEGPYEPLDAQVEAVKHCLNNGRAIIIAPTAMGKSYAIHALASVHAYSKKKILIIIDRAQLVEQLRTNMADEYNGSKFFKYSTVYDKVSLDDVDIHVSTWQSIVDYPKSWFEQFGVLIGDEVHKFKAASLKNIIDKCGHIDIRYGFTATLDNDSQTDRLTLKGMFGTPHRVATIKELIDQGIVTPPIVKAIILEYPDEHKKKVTETTKKVGDRVVKKDATEQFRDEIDFIEAYEPRLAFIGKLDKHLDGNTLIAFRREKHGEALLNYVRDDAFYVSGKVDVKKRLAISEKIENMDNATAVVSIGTFSTGVNIKKVNNIIVACQIQSKITVPQLIGRGMRKHDGKKAVYIYDIGDDLTWKGKENTSLKHFKERLTMYASFGFNIQIEKIRLK